LNINYRFSKNKPSHREAADPTMVVHNDTYWLFASKSGGYWHSTDMNDWSFVTPTGLPIEDYAPMVVVLGNGRFYYTAFNSAAIYTTDDPYVGKWTKEAGMSHYQDPGMLVDDDGKVYMYSGCSDNGPIKAVELSNTTWKEIGTPVDAVTPDYTHRGFEVGGDNNEQLKQTPWVEGAFMNKIDGKYYLQYAVPGTQYKSYADGLFVGDSPLGPFTFQAHSPMSSRPVGFAAGAGHGSSYAVPGTSTYYHISTASISVRQMFERRLTISPLITSNKDMLWVDTYLSDYPQPLPHIASSPSVELRAAPKWMLLSLNKAASSSSGNNSSLAFNEDIRTWWSADTGSKGEWLEVDLGGSYTVNAVQTNFADENSTIIGERPAEEDAYKYFVEYCTGVSAPSSSSTSAAAPSSSSCDWKSIDALNRSTNTRDMPHDYVELPVVLVGVTKMRITNIHMPGNATFSLSGFRIFGLGPASGSGPAAVPAAAVKVVRDPIDPRHATVSWEAAHGAGFYVLRFGITADFYSTVHNYQVYGSTTAEIHSLVAGERYEFVVDSVNSNGVTYGEKPK
jgi:hypothetical protein